MTVIKPILFKIFERFPERIKEIKTFFKNSESFKTLCEDYCRCAAALQHWSQSLDKNAPDRLQEYEALLRELEEEILQIVKKQT